VTVTGPLVMSGAPHPVNPPSALLTIRAGLSGSNGGSLMSETPALTLSAAIDYFLAAEAEAAGEDRALRIVGVQLELLSE